MDTAVRIFLSSVFFITMSFIFDKNICKTIFRIEAIIIPLTWTIGQLCVFKLFLSVS